MFKNSHGVIGLTVLLCCVCCIICVLISISCRNNYCNHRENIPRKHYRRFNKEFFDAIDNNYANGIVVPKLKTNEFEYKNKNFDEILHPVGSIYISFDKTNPKDIFGFGTWEQINGKFLYCSDSSGTVGGASFMTLTVDNLPSHSHTFTGNALNGEFKGVISTDKLYGPSGIVKNTFWRDSWQKLQNGSTKYGQADYKITATPSGTISNVGNGKAFNILPPYITVYCWRRTK